MQGVLVEAAALGIVAVRVRIVRRREETVAEQLGEFAGLERTVLGDQRQGVMEPAPGFAREGDIGLQADGGRRAAGGPDGEFDPDCFWPGRQRRCGRPRPTRQRGVFQRMERPIQHNLGRDTGHPVDVVVPGIPFEPMVGLEQAGCGALPFGGAPERLRVRGFRVAIHDQGAPAHGGGLRRLAPVVAVGDRGLPGPQHGRRRRDVDAGLARPGPVLEGRPRRGIGGHGAVDRQPGSVAHFLEEAVLDRLLAGRQDEFEIGAVFHVGEHAPGGPVDGPDLGQSGGQGEAEEVQVGVPVAVAAVPEDPEDETPPLLGMDRAVEEGAAE